MRKLREDVPDDFYQRGQHAVRTETKLNFLEDLTMNRTKLNKRIVGRKNQFGQGMTEYIIIVALVAIGAIAVYSAFGHAVTDQMSAITNGLAGNAGGATAAVNEAKTEAQAATTDATTARGLDTYATDIKDQ
jgi:type IV pilus assembly protein PilA